MVEQLELFIRSSVEYGTPLLLAALGEIYAERSGVINLGLEGLMAVSAALAFLVSLTTGDPWLGLAAAVAAAAALSAVHATFSVVLRANQIVSGLALTVAGLGLSSVIGAPALGLKGVPITSVIDLPFIERVPGLAGVDRLDPLAYAGMVLAGLLWLVLFKTDVGLVLRATGEDPAVVEAMGHNVRLVRYASVLFGGAMAGAAGAYLTLVMSPGWFEGMTAGRGWIALGIVILASWNPLRALIASYVIGALMQVRFVLAPHLGVSGTLLSGLPYLLVIVMLTAVSVEAVRKRIGAPASLGKPYPP